MFHRKQAIHKNKKNNVERTVYNTFKIKFQIFVYVKSDFSSLEYILI